ncbi:MAG: RNA-directed DNA polymerase [Acidobacteria bacterium]|nr:RNA-directed DNA polymerase [Acidobacteriota bacterium]
MSRPAAPSQPTRENLYQRIRETSKAEVVLEEMIRLGFWPAGEGIPKGPEAEDRRTGELENELAALRTEMSRLQNEAAMRRALYQKRLEEARQKRQETRRRQEEARRARAAAWKQAKEREIGYLGEGISAGLNHQLSDATRLAQHGLPLLSTALDVASAMDISVGELRFLTFVRRVSKHTHYRRFFIPKKTGGQRLISTPMPRLKQAQYWVLGNILERIPIHSCAHGFVAKHSIVTNASMHTGTDVVVNCDLENFFPTISYRRVRGLFRALGYSEQVATILALLCTEPEVDRVECDGETYHLCTSERHLPQGAPSSPMLTNILCRRLDRRLSNLAETLGFSYSRYADDLTFSGSGEARGKVGKLLRKTEGIVSHEGFRINRDKTRVQRRGRRQEVTGIVVNERPAVNRENLRRMRAVLFRLEKDGLRGQHWGRGGEVISALEGYAHFVAQVDPAKGGRFLEQLVAIKAKLGWQRPKHLRRPKRTPSWKRSATAPAATPADVMPAVAQPAKPEPATPPKKPWWKFW